MFPKDKVTYYSINQAAQMADTSPSVLRIWEKRYGWPNPYRNPTNGYRSYTLGDIDNVRRVLAESKNTDRAVREIIDYGHLTFTSIVKRPEEKIDPLCVDRALGQPHSGNALEFRKQLVHALLRGDGSKVLSMLHTAGMTLRPSDRDAACYKVIPIMLAEYDRVKQTFPRRDELENFLRSIAGMAIAV